MKKLFSVIISFLCLCFCLCGCSDSADNNIYLARSYKHTYSDAVGYYFEFNYVYTGNKNLSYDDYIFNIFDNEGNEISAFSYATIVYYVNGVKYNNIGWNNSIDEIIIVPNDMLTIVLELEERTSYPFYRDSIDTNMNIKIVFSIVSNTEKITTLSEKRYNIGKLIKETA